MKNELQSTTTHEDKTSALLWVLWGISALAPIIVLALWITGQSAITIPSPLVLAGLLCLAPFAITLILNKRHTNEKARANKRIEDLIAELELSQDELWEKHAQDQRLEKAESSNRAKSRFLATVSHEIRTPLNGILGMTDLLAETTLSSDQRAYNDAVKKSGTALLSLINDILDFSKIEAGQLNLLPSDISLNELLEGTAELLAPRAYEKDIDLAAYIDPALPKIIHADGERLRQVLFNLVGNAIKFTEKGGVILSAERSKNGILFSVRDTGIGIADEAKLRIFQEFGQADEGTERAFGGTGLGLAISHHIVGAFGSELSVESTLGEGSCFQFEIIQTFPAAVPAHAPLKNRSILLISPQKPEADVFIAQAKDDGAVITSARSLVEAQAKIAAAEAAGEIFNLIAVDARFIDKPNGAMKTLNEATAKMPPSVVLIAPRDRQKLAAIKKAGFQSYLMRPIRASSFSRVALDLIKPTAKKQTSFISDPADLNKTKKPKRRTKASSNSVLLVEDNPINALLSRALLQREGWQVESVENGQDAVAHIEQGSSFDLILMDLHMPGMDGLSAARIIRKLEKERGLPETTILTLTADATDEARIAALDAGMNAILTKPIDIELFRHEVGKIQHQPDNSKYKAVTKL